MQLNLSIPFLFLLNATLLVILVFSASINMAEAQVTPTRRYMAIDGEVNGLTSGVVYILDTTTQELVAITWDHNENRLVPLGYRPVAADAASAPKD
tara:strand:- start:526 stop:813 length:288 start_codon:yes stop_codon:yes gene_type:complete